MAADQNNAARIDWRLLTMLVPILLVTAGGLVAWGELNAAQRHINDRVTKLELREEEGRAASTRVLERLTAIEVRIEEVKRLLGARLDLDR
jgi:hypothetical protein